jgi:hypothetical protein
MGAAAVGGAGNAEACTCVLFCGGTELVTSVEGAFDILNGLTSKRPVSALQPTKATATDASMVKRMT